MSSTAQLARMIEATRPIRFVPQVTATVRGLDDRLWEIYAKPVGTLTDEDVAYLNYVEREAE
jgi:hypothetical protein